jgi:predicted Zn-dependent protease
MSRLTLLGGILILVLLQSCNKTPDKVISINPTDFPPADQLKIGYAFKEQIDNNPEVFKMLSHSEYPEAYQYLTTLFKTLLNTAPIEHRLEYDWTLDIIHDDSIRTAFFLPGGHLYIYTGLLKFLDSESQLLGVVGHELYYVDTELLVRLMSGELGGTVLGDILLDKEVENLDKLASAIPSLAFEEDKVMLADSFSVQLVCPFQYEPLGIKSIVEKADRNKQPLLWLQTRPANLAARLQHIEEQAINCGLPGVTNEENYQNFKRNYLP